MISELVGLIVQQMYYANVEKDDKIKTDSYKHMMYGFIGELIITPIMIEIWCVHYSVHYLWCIVVMLISIILSTCLSENMRCVHDYLVVKSMKINGAMKTP